MNISVVIPSYNRADLLPETLNAVLGQTHQPAEIIVVDDGSTDDTPSVLAGFAPRVQHIRIPNSGELVTRNTGIRAATGDLVAFCDSDDLWRPEFLAEMVALWEAEPGLHAAYSDFVIVRDGEWLSERKFASAPPGFWDWLRPVGPHFAVFDQPVVERILKFQPFFPSAMVANRAKFLELGGWDEGVSRIIGCDLATVLRIADAPPVGIVQKPLVGIRKHVSNFSGDVQAMNLGDALVLEHVLRTRPGMEVYAAAIQASVAERRRQALATAFTRKDMDAVRAIYSLLPGEALDRSILVKHRIASLPKPLNRLAASLMLGLGSFKSRFRK
ncbi:MAG TPA: glycosyltransferase [Acetobacteraceae bacterium]|nr:glycosyltransferase [Acetobacteraceae bacterium]